MGERTLIGIQWDLAREQMARDHGSSWATRVYEKIRNIVVSWGGEKEGNSFYVFEGPDAESAAAWALVDIGFLVPEFHQYAVRFSVFRVERRYDGDDVPVFGV